jgi:ubiquitin carboxyl-terminal hydrolase 14
LSLDADTNEDASILKAQIFGLTSIHPDKQKILLKGGKTITDTTDMKSLDLRDGSVIMLIGTPDDKQEKMDLSKKALFAEDLTSADKARIYQQKTGVRPSLLQNYRK